MKIIKANIENYGRLHKCTYEFESGLAVFEELNGWGKSTMASFVKAMFYGLEYSRAKAARVERRQYYPWNGGKFGGSLDFEANGKTYRVTRFFGLKASDDSFELLNLATNTSSRDFDSDLGLALWGVDRDSYEKTAFITLSKSELLSDLIATRLSELEIDEADLDESSAALNLLEKQLTSYLSKRGNKGIIPGFETTIATVRRDIEAASQANRDLEQLALKNGKDHAALVEVENQIKTIELAQGQLLGAQKKQVWLGLEEELGRAKAHYESQREFFQAVAGDEELISQDLGHIEDNLKLWELNRGRLEENQLEQSEQDELNKLEIRFVNGQPDNDTLELWEKKARELDRLQSLKQGSQLSLAKLTRFDQLQSRFANQDLDSLESYLEAYGQVMAIDQELSQLESGHGDTNSSSSKILAVVALALFVAGVVLVALGQLAGGLLIGCGLVLGLYRWRGSKKGPDVKSKGDESQSIADLKANKARLSQPYLDYLGQAKANPADNFNALTQLKMDVGEYRQLDFEINQNSEMLAKTNKTIGELTTALESFLASYGIAGSDDFHQALVDLGKTGTRFNSLKVQNSNWQKAQAAFNQAKHHLDTIFSKYYEPDSPQLSGFDYQQLAKSLQEMAYEYKNAKVNYGNAKTKLADFAATTDLAKLEEVQDIPGNLENLHDTYASNKDELNGERQGLIATITLNEMEMARLERIGDGLEDLQSQMLDLNEQKQVATTSHKLLLTAYDCMATAKEDLSSKYTAGMNQAFKKYLKLLQGENPDLYQVDINLGVNYMQEGQSHSSGNLSKGMQDLVQICLRLALVEAVYQGDEKPVLILDDPFVNLDALRLEGAKELVKTIANDYQVIYFVCHESRKIASSTKQQI